MAALSQALLDVGRKCEGLSGRTLRKLPLLAHRTDPRRRRSAPACATFIAMMDAAVDAELQDRGSCRAAGG